MVPPLKLIANTDENVGLLDVLMTGFCAVPPVTMLVPPDMLCTYVVAVERNWFVEAVDKNSLETSVFPENNVFPLIFVANTDENVGSVEVLMIGFCAVPPVTMLVPPDMLCTYVVAVDRNWFVEAVDKNSVDTSLPPENIVEPLKLFENIEENVGSLEVLIIGFCAVPPVTILLPSIMLKTPEDIN